MQIRRVCFFYTCYKYQTYSEPKCNTKLETEYGALFRLRSIYHISYLTVDIRLHVQNNNNKPWVVDFYLSAKLILSNCVVDVDIT